ncbi:MAG: hypothetical protein JNK84_09685 [Phreatobacter sp.]|uniref:hypothetical protein n=1 Tax=Phreatobacter sp. TaxID=1966341 RepID=UPI001A39529F|nr:hypothetical protein [Phreatobacter sp.]MBL8569346.1 hypothetical protein [Phreatobacter sp.]
MTPDAWRAEYQKNRYLRETHPERLAERLDALTTNLWSTDAAGDVTPPRHAAHRANILRLILHVILEQMERDGTSQIEFNEKALREAAVGAYAPPALKSPFVGPPSCYAKFGKRHHIQSSFERGIFRIAPASSYDDPSLNPAQADKELEHFTVTPNEQLLFKVYALDPLGGEVETPVKPLELFRFMQVPDYYVWCCALGYDARLFHEFKADAALVVRDKGVFRKRLEAAVSDIHPNITMLHGSLSYYDPYQTARSLLKPIFSKNFKYLYQNEYRFAWRTSLGTDKLEPFNIEIGPMSDIAELYETT